MKHCRVFLQYSNVNTVCRHADITSLQLLHIITTTVVIQQQQQQQQQQQPEQGHHCSDIVHDNAWVAHLDEANTQIALLVCQLKAQSTCRAACARHTSTTAVAATHSLPELTQAVISAISGLRKVLQAKVSGKAAAGQCGSPVSWYRFQHDASLKTVLHVCLHRHIAVLLTPLASYFTMINPTTNTHAAMICPWQMGRFVRHLIRPLKRQSCSSLQEH